MPQTAPFISHSPESREAALQAAPSAGSKRAAVLRFLASRGLHGATDDEMQLGLGMNPSTQRPRRIELYEGGHVAKLTNTRETRTGRQAAVWAATAAVQHQLSRKLYKLWPEQ
jgi:transcription initiation factor IIE alpha subunit